MHLWLIYCNCKKEAKKNAETHSLLIQTEKCCGICNKIEWMNKNDRFFFVVQDLHTRFICIRSRMIAYQLNGIWIMNGWLAGLAAYMSCSVMQMVMPVATSAMPTYVIVLCFCSPSSIAVNAVNRNVHELATGTATDKCACCNVYTYNTLPHWLIRNGTMYCQRVIKNLISVRIFGRPEVVGTLSTPVVPRRINGLVTPHKIPTRIRFKLCHRAIRLIFVVDVCWTFIVLISVRRRLHQNDTDFVIYARQMILMVHVIACILQG